MITQRDKDNFKARFDGLIDDLNRSVTIHFKPSNQSCPNCFFNRSTRRSSGILDTTNPNPAGPLNIPFQNGSVCPVCVGAGKLKTARNTTIIATIGKKIDEFDDIAQQLGRRPVNLVKLRTKIDVLQDVKDAERATIDGRTYRRVMPVITQGLGDLQYTKSFWEQESNG